MRTVRNPCHLGVTPCRTGRVYLQTSFSPLAWSQRQPQGTTLMQPSCLNPSFSLERGVSLPSGKVRRSALCP